MRPLRQPRGFTLMELMVSVVVVAFSISLVMGIFIAQQKSFQGLDLMRVAQEAGRDASIDFETSLRRAGFGLDPQYAFDFSRYACSPTPCRDHIDNPDEIVFYARNPNYLWSPTACAGDNSGGCFQAGKGWSMPTTPTGSSMQISFRANEALHLFPGQMLELTQINGANPMMVVVSTELDIPKGLASTQTIQLDSTQQIGTLPNPNSWSGYVAAFLVDRYRYFISTQTGTPYLMFDSGLRIGGSATTEQVPVAKNVEDLQIAYVMNAPVGGGTGKDSNGNWIVGDAPGAVEQPDPAITPPDYVNTPQTAAARYTLSPANIRGVRYSFTIRSDTPDLSMFTPGANNVWQGDPFLYQENRNANAPALGGYRRLVISGSVLVRNLETRNSFTY